METVAEQPAPETAPRPKIDITDAMTLLPRLFAGFLMGGVSILYIITHQWGMVAFLWIASTVLLFTGFRLMMKMRSENTEYIAYRAAQEAEERARKAARK